MHDIETQSEFATVMDKSMILAVKNIETILDDWDTNMCPDEVDKFHHLMEIVHMAKVTKAMPVVTK